MNKAVFVDRDGTINVEVDYLSSVNDLVLIDKALDALKLLKDSGYLIIVVTNQSGIARGYFTEDDLELIHNELKSRLTIEKNSEKSLIDDIYFSPFHSEGSVDKYTKNSECRKPGTGMILKAAAEHEIDLAASFMIGDSFADMQLAENAGMKSFLVKTGYGKKTYEKCIESGIIPFRYVNSIFEASEIISKIKI
ncbi:N/A [soil metagenome]